MYVLKKRLFVNKKLDTFEPFETLGSDSLDHCLKPCLV